MRINILELRNFKGFKHMVLPFDGKSTVLFGVNGAGKSSVLDAINIIFAKMIGSIMPYRLRQIDNLTTKNIKYGESTATVSLDLLLSSNDIARPEFKIWATIERKSGKKQYAKDAFNALASTFRENYIDNYDDMPIFVNYGASRAVRDISLKRSQTDDESYKLSAFDKAIANVIDFKCFFEWFRERQEYVTNTIVYDYNNYSDKQLASVKKAVLSMLDEFTDIRIMFNPLRMAATKYGENLIIEQLSDGEKCTLALFGDLARRLAIANPHNDEPLNGAGIVLIDELELHLHPTWQSRILGGLRRTFPNIQFIVTTHSPKVLSEFGGEIKLMSLENLNGNISATALPPLDGWNVSDILQNNMGTSPYSMDAQKKIDNFFTLIQNGSFDEAKKSVDEFEATTSALHPEVVKARVLLARRKSSK